VFYSRFIGKVVLLSRGRKSRIIKMKMWLLSLLLVVMVTVKTDADVPPPERPYNILMLVPLPSKSHRNVFLPLANALADRGHKITLLSMDDPVTNHPNIVEYMHLKREELEEREEFKGHSMFDHRANPSGAFSMLGTVIEITAQNLYNFPHIKELYARRNEFDLVVIDHMFNEVVYPFAHEKTWITIATVGMDYRQSAIYGNVQNPAFSPNTLASYPRPYTLVNRIKNVFTMILFAQFWRRNVVPGIETELAKHFPNLPSMLEIERNQSLVLMNSHLTFDMPYPLLPNQVEVGGMHCRPSKPLPKKMLDWVEGSGRAGVVYFSLGSVAKGDTLPAKYRALFVEAFRQLEQRVIWKYEQDLPGLSDNVLLTDWAPQQDILGHPSVKVFISHCGLLSTQESVYHGTPILGVPIFGDQPKNAKMIQMKNFGLHLEWEELTIELIVDSLREIINNDKYQQSISVASREFRDQPQTPVERAVFWTEYVIRHQGAPHLKSPSVQLSWIQYFMIDAIIVLLVGLIVFLKLLIVLVRKIKNMLCGGRSKAKSD
ncbi:unnamed protein product, partial [Meganyctiphanes norvegica]